MLSRYESARLDAWITREPDEVEMYCPNCGLNAEDCEEVEEHEGQFVTMAERASDEAEDYAFDLWHDEH